MFKNMVEIEDALKKIYKEDNSNRYNWRCNYHFDSPFGLINDPNGFCYYNGYYYIFFQWNPYGCDHSLKHWGLVKTKDFINYTRPEIALIPENWYDRNGCYSGSGIIKDNQLQIIYTGNVKDQDGKRFSYQCLATMEENGQFKKHGPIIDTIPRGYTSHFRDPKVFFYDDRYYLIIGAQNEELKGRILVYTSDNLQNWGLKGELKTKLENWGYMWECPNYVRMKNKDILIFSPQGLKKEKYNYQNLYQSGYIIGDLDLEGLQFSHGKFKELDKGFDFYAPHVMVDNKGRTIMIGWMGMPEEEKLHPSKKEGWVYGLTMPRELILKDDILYQQPVEEMKGLREDAFYLENVYFDKFRHEKVKGHSYELSLSLERHQCKEIQVKLALGESEYTSFKYDFITNTATLDRTNMKKGPKGVRKLKLDNTNLLQIRVFMDKSAMEIYIEDGKEVMTSRIYPEEGSENVEILGIGGQYKIKELKFWTLKGVTYDG